MKGFTLLIELSPKGEIQLDSCMVSQPSGSQAEEALLACVQTAVQACIEQLKHHYESGVPITYDDHSQKAAAVFRQSLEEFLRTRNPNN